MSTQQQTGFLAAILVLSGGHARAQGFGPGVLAPPVEVAETNIGPIVAQDADADGDIDLLALTQGNGSVSLVLNDGAGSFGEAQILPFCPAFDVSSGYGLADLDADGLPDLITLLYETLCVKKGLGGGTFVPAGQQALLLATVTTSHAVADLDGDGLLDLLLHGGGSSGGFYYAAKGQGDLSLGPYGVLVGARQPTSFSAGDVDLDGDADVLSLETIGVVIPEERQLVTYANAGSGLLDMVAATDFLGVDDLVSPPVDLDRDGVPDVLAWNGLDGRIQALLGAGEGSFAPQLVVDAAEGVAQARATDVDADGFVDLAWIERTEVLEMLHVQRLVDLATVGTSVSYPAGLQGNQLASADLDGDGLQDVALSEDLEVYINTLGPIQDLGLGAPGGPTLAVTGVPAAGEALTILLDAAGGPTSGLLFVGLQPLLQPLGGTLLVPDPIAAVAVAAPGRVAAVWPAGVPAGTLVYVQAFVAQTGGPAGSNAVLLVPEP